MSEDKKYINKIKSQRGSVTLFILVVMMFFLIILVSLFASTKTKLIEQEKQIAIIQNEYESENINQVMEQKYTEILQKTSNQ